MRVYLAGPIHSPVGVEKPILVKRFYKLADWLQRKYPYWSVVNPLDCSPGCEGTPYPCQDRSGLPSGEGHSWECWMKGDLRQMLLCDALVLLPHWEKSNGASLEAEIAQRLHMPLYVASLHPEEGNEDGSLGWLISSDIEQHTSTESSR